MTFPVDREDFVAFLLEAKRKTYASGAGEAAVPPALPGSHQLGYASGALLYRDVYFGGAFFAGQETLYYEGQPIGAMVYAGGLLDTPLTDVEVGTFLQAALREVMPERPFRGPAQFRRGDLAYFDESHGDVERFWGVERIFNDGSPAYELRYAGGVLR